MFPKFLTATKKKVNMTWNHVSKVFNCNKEKRKEKNKTKHVFNCNNHHSKEILLVLSDLWNKTKITENSDLKNCVLSMLSLNA